MTYEEFLKFVPANCIYETIYKDSDGRDILVIKLLDAYGMVNKAQRKWVSLTDDDIAQAMFRADAIITGPMQYRFASEVEAALRGKNT